MAQPILIDSPAEVDMSGRPWWRHLSGYHWFVFFIASSAWMFDCLDQRLFSLARNPALGTLMGKPPTDIEVQSFGKVVTAWFLIGWGTGGMLFGALGDKFGRARMLIVTIVIYALFTGLSFFSQTRFDFTACRFLTGLGVGGVFGLAVALISESIPAVARVQTLGLLQILSTVGNVLAVFIKWMLDSFEKSGLIHTGTGWRYMFLVGALPALLVLLSGPYLREPEVWVKLKREGRLAKGGLLSPYRNLITSKRWRKNLIVGALIASTGVIGLWAIGEYAVDLQGRIFDSYFSAEAAAGRIKLENVKLDIERAKTIAYFLNMLGAGMGMWLFTKVAHATGRRMAFAIGFAAALATTVYTYWAMKTPTDAYWMMPLMGAGQLGPFAGFAIYLPELFPGSLRSTGTSFCYNLGRFAAAGGSFFSAYLTTLFATADTKSSMPLRYSAITMCAIFLVGLATLPFSPETKGRPLPTDDGEGVPAGFPVIPAGSVQPTPRGT